MHEYGIVSSLVQAASGEAALRNATAVRRIRVRVGELAGVDPTLLSLAWETFRERSVCAGAELELVTVPARWACRRCGMSLEPGSVLRHCGAPAHLAEGDELFLDRVELEVEDV